MEGTNSQRAAPGYDAVAQCAVITPFSQPITPFGCLLLWLI